MVQKLKQLYADSLFRNSFYLMLNTATAAGFGFFFWLVCARIYSTTDVGLATALISAVGLTSVFSMLGFNNVLVRFLATSERKNEQISTALILTAVASFVAAGVFLLCAFATHNPTVQTGNVNILIAIFTIYVLANTLNSIIESVLIAHRTTSYIFVKNIIFSALKLTLVFFIVSIGFIGIVSAVTLSMIITVAIGFILLMAKFHYHPMFTIDKETIDETKHFAIGNYFGTLFGVLPSTVLILIVVSRLGAQDAAFFYIPSMVVTLLNIIPSSISQSLFAEVSHNEEGFMRYFKKALQHLFSFLIPAVLVIWLIGGYVLGFFGPSYAAAGTAPLDILALASLIGAANYLGDTLLNIKKRPGMYLFMNALNAIAVVVPAYFLAPYGLAAIAWGALFGQVLTAVVYLAMNWGLVTGSEKVHLKHDASFLQ